MGTRIKHVLVAIRDLHHPPRTELRKAAELARAAKAGIELFHAVDVASRTPQAALSAGERQLRKFACLSLLRGLKVAYHCNSDYPPAEAIVRRAVKTRTDLVVLASRTHGLASRMFLRNTDWEVIRQCPCPVLLVKSTRPYARSIILAAVDPFHTHAKPADLDAKLVEMGDSLAKLFKGSLHVVHAFTPLVNAIPLPVATAVPMVAPPEAEEAHVELIVSELARLSRSAGVAPKAQHLRMGAIASELCSVARGTGASILVMGAVSRSALRRVFIGSTAESVLDKLGCDALVIKPRGFRSTVEARPFVAGRIRTASRRVQLVSHTGRG